MTRSPTPADPAPDSIEQLSQALQQAREAVQARDDFLAIAAHELRSPMHALALQLAVLERSAESLGAAPLVTDIRRVQTTLDRYVRRATVLLDVTQLQAGRPVLRRSHVDAGELVREVVQAYAAEAAFHGSRLVVVGADISLPAVTRSDAAHRQPVELLDKVAGEAPSLWAMALAD